MPLAQWDTVPQAAAGRSRAALWNADGVLCIVPGMKGPGGAKGGNCPWGMAKPGMGQPARRGHAGCSAPALDPVPATHNGMLHAGQLLYAGRGAQSGSLEA